MNQVMFKYFLKYKIVLFSALEAPTDVQNLDPGNMWLMNSCLFINQDMV